MSCFGNGMLLFRTDSISLLCNVAVELTDGVIENYSLTTSGKVNSGLGKRLQFTVCIQKLSRGKRLLPKDFSCSFLLPVSALIL